ncbi:SDR family NAD(P)-dependent oxidoreductase [Cellulomonas alba]|uniref:SDR family NAD(P)-dependent oxidoreductase n=1 Tax=Cellulomonas alba TaxID=3053467 RepID=A0ABT7SF74_9CELL|nr:SDR family NAD(P)-dependent oxidoreductase [Cellulomonas alba]MDM7854840.1 SDR family NAD(P)-dependent oxidoreductase [Cellulomonas alba]
MTQGQRALVTGGGTGIGRAIARRLALDGFDVTVVGRRRDRLEEAREAIDAETGRDAVSVETADLREPADVRALAERWTGPLDALVLNAGGTREQPEDTLEQVAERWLEQFRLNVLTTVLTADAFLPHLSRPGGRVVAMSSVAALRGAGSYGAAKAAINSWATWLAREVAAEGITVNAVAPGFVPGTEFWAEQGLTDDDRRARLARIPAGRGGTPEEVAAAVAYLVGPDAGWTTGQVLGIHGGAVLARL